MVLLAHTYVAICNINRVPVVIDRAMRALRAPLPLIVCHTIAMVSSIARLAKRTNINSVLDWSGTRLMGLNESIRMIISTIHVVTVMFRTTTRIPVLRLNSTLPI